jgi:tetratricopeptide (TPR) repeat protein
LGGFPGNKAGRLIGWLATAVALGGLGTASWWSAQAGWADYWARQETVVGAGKAVAAMPGEAAYHVRLATLVADQDPQRAVEELHRAVALNPWDARSWIELGLRSEGSGDLAGAEASLLRAAAADQTYLPRWTLANFYFRRDNRERFWFWARAAAEMVYGDPAALFQLCGRVAEDGRLIERLAIRNPEVRSRYLTYLLEKQRVDLIAPVTGQLLNDHREADVPLLLGVCERLIETKHGDEAVEIWNRLAQEGRISQGSLDPTKGMVLTNGAFAVPPTSRGFDWRLPGPEGIIASREENPVGLRLTFSGRQAERAEVLTQVVPTQENTEYQLQARYRTSEIAAGSGLSWRITDLDGASLAIGRSLSSEEETTERLAFRTPAGCRLVRLTLAYQRTPGTTRIEGTLILRNVALDPAQLPSGEAPRSRTTK